MPIIGPWEIVMVIAVALIWGIPRMLKVKRTRRLTTIQSLLTLAVFLIIIHLQYYFVTGIWRW